MVGGDGCEQGYIQCSLCYSSRQVNQANPLFSYKTWKLSFNQWEVKEAPWQPMKKQETQCCSGCELPQKLFQPCAFVVRLSSSYLFSSSFSGCTSWKRATQELSAHHWWFPRNVNDRAVNTRARRRWELIAMQWQVDHCIAVCLATEIFLTAVQRVVTTTPTHTGKGNGLA